MKPFNPLNAELNPICHLLALLEAHHILHVSRVRVQAECNNTRLYIKTDSEPPPPTHTHTLLKVFHMIIRINSDYFV